MSFIKPNEEYKIHINLSYLAASVLDSDMFHFHTTSRSGFINRIFDNYKENANASIGLMLSKKAEQWESILQSMPSCSSEQLSDTLKKEIMDTLAKKFVDRALHEISSYRLSPRNPKETSWKIRLNQKNIDYLVNDPSCGEDIYYKDSIGKYLCAVIEEYSRKPFLEREEIYYKDELDMINSAITLRRRLKVKLPAEGNTKTHKILYIDPYKIVTDPQSLYHYLLGCSVDTKNTPGFRQFYSYRISRFSEVRALSSQRSAITDEEKRQLEYLLQTKGAQFISGTNANDTIKVFLTPAGIKKYNSIQHLRPKHTELSMIPEKGAIYTFDCTQNQIEFYFFKFGADAEILEPEDLRNKFAEMYEEALKNYTSR